MIFYDKWLKFTRIKADIHADKNETYLRRELSQIKRIGDKPLHTYWISLFERHCRDAQRLCLCLPAEESNCVNRETEQLATYGSLKVKRLNKTAVVRKSAAFACALVTMTSCLVGKENVANISKWWWHAYKWAGTAEACSSSKFEHQTWHARNISVNWFPKSLHITRSCFTNNTSSGWGRFCPANLFLSSDAAPRFLHAFLYFRNTSCV